MCGGAHKPNLGRSGRMAESGRQRAYRRRWPGSHSLKRRGTARGLGAHHGQRLGGQLEVLEDLPRDGGLFDAGEEPHRTTRLLTAFMGPSPREPDHDVAPFRARRPDPSGRVIDDVHASRAQRRDTKTNHRSVGINRPGHRPPQSHASSTLAAPKRQRPGRSADSGDRRRAECPRAGR